MATLRNIAINAIRFTGANNIAKALRHNNRNPSRAEPSKCSESPSPKQRPVS
jgi:hypothetical protein